MMGSAPVLDVEDGLCGGRGSRAVTSRRSLAYLCAAALVIALAATSHSVWRDDRGIAEQTGGTYSDFEHQSSSQDRRLHNSSGDPHPAKGGGSGFAPPPPPPHTGATISVDLGGSYSYAGVWSGGAIADTELIVGVTGQHAMSSFVAHNGSDFHVAQPHEPKAIFDAKYLLGRRFSNNEFKNLTARLPFHVQQNPRQRSQPMIPALDTTGKEVLLHPEVAAAETLFQVKVAASAHLGQEVTGAVLAVPVWFNDLQRQAVMDAGVVAGMNILRIVNEPTAAATAYGLDLQDDKSALVFHCGASSFYIALLSFDHNITEVISEVSDPRLSGRAFDQRLLEHVLSEYQREHGHEAPEDERFRYQLLKHVETAKRELSSVVEVGIEVEAPDGFPNVSVTITRDRFEELAEDLFEVASESLERVNEEVGLELKKVDDLVFSGGSMHIPKLRTLVGEALGKKARQGIEPEEVIARGASIIAGRPIPELEGCCPDLTHVTISVEGAGGLMQPLIKHGSVIPISERMLLTTMAENQTSLQLRFFAGFRPLAKHNRFITEVNLTGIARAATEGARVLLQLDIDDNMFLHVLAFDLLGGHSVGTTVAADVWLLGHDEAWKMIKFWDSERFAAEDKAAVEELQNAGHTRCWPSLKQIPLSEEIPWFPVGSTVRPSMVPTEFSLASLYYFEEGDRGYGVRMAAAV